MDTVFFVFEMIGVIAFALSGAMLGIKKEMDVLGVCVMGAVTAVGGGITRDLLLGETPPTFLIDPTATAVAVCTSILVFLPISQRLLQKNTRRLYDTLMLIADSIGLGIFAVMGVNITLQAKPTASLFMCVLLGVITGVGGGVLRDVLSRSKPYIFVKHFYACAAIIGALLCAVLHPILGELPSSIIGLVTIVVLRLLAAKFHWKLPKYIQSDPKNDSESHGAGKPTQSQ